MVNRALLFVILGIAAHPLVLAVARSISVCEVLRNPVKYRNRIVSVSGLYIRGPHGATVMEEDCGFPNRYPIFGNGAAADLDGFSAVGLNAPTKVNERSIEHFYKAVSRAVVNGHPPEFEVTFLVTVQVADPYTTREFGDGFEGTGFGFMGRYPARFLLLQVNSYRQKGDERI